MLGEAGADQNRRHRGREGMDPGGGGPPLSCWHVQ
jgi:hypothetical protein